MKGIDISSVQGNIDFAKVKANDIQIVYIKATEGKTYQNPLFKTHYTNAKANGLSIGVYHFLRRNLAEDEANNFLNTIRGLEFDCKYMIDCETAPDNSAPSSEQLRAFADVLISKGLEVVLYTGESFYNSKLNDSVKDLPLWVAKYSSNKPNVSKDYIGWQYTSSGSVNGISGRVDMNDFTDAIFIGNNAPINNSQPVQQPEQDTSVLETQKKLRRLNIPDYEGKQIVCDNEMGKRTHSAIQKFEEIMALSVDTGVWGGQCEKAYQEIISKPYCDKDNQSHKYAVRYIQWLTGAKPIDGLWGKISNNCVYNWQERKGISADSKFGNQSWGKAIG